MKVEYDPVHDLLNLEFLSGVAIEDSVDIDGVILDYAKDKRIVVIEVLAASKRTTRDPCIASMWRLSEIPRSKRSLVTLCPALILVDPASPRAQTPPACV